MASHPDRPWKIADFKEIEISGIPEIKSQLIPMVNEYGIQVGISEIDEMLHEKPRKHYIVEFAVPLQYFGLTDLDLGAILDYAVVLQGVIPHPSAAGPPMKPSGIATEDPSSGRVFTVSEKEINEMFEDMLDTQRRTELKGTYRLATKPD
ncbi:hypothetical protein [Sphingobacterium paucimobilis]|uniref:Uncharacterized protein n=1 Tax=Sphingobacterium paucimobilis HER1398 TaxID=1346330 RepID=U2HY00_9SPHI|nr:hypothetical protein [Sphingobacterium paucimobilis]ERJ60140.1 hypothetical protein M472_15360 [Sphingobacterium paucimobilis HER1398]